MAENLSFSIANILRSDFPDPSRISKLPSIGTPLRQTSEALFATRGRFYGNLHYHCNETRPFGRNIAHSSSIDGLKNLKDVPQNFFGTEEEQRNRLFEELKGKHQ